MLAVSWVDTPNGPVCGKQNKTSYQHLYRHMSFSLFSISFCTWSPFVNLLTLSPSLNTLIATSPPPPYIRSPHHSPPPPFSPAVIQWNLLTSLKTVNCCRSRLVSTNIPHAMSCRPLAFGIQQLLWKEFYRQRQSPIPQSLCGRLAVKLVERLVRGRLPISFHSRPLTQRLPAECKIIPRLQGQTKGCCDHLA